MESKLANIISNLLFLGLEIFITDTECFLKRVHFSLHEFPILLSTKWNVFWGKMQKPIITSEALNCCKETCVDVKRIPFAEINLILSRVGIVGLDDCENKSKLGEEDFLTMFDDEEPSFKEIKETFEVFDVNNDGLIDAMELQRVVCGLGLKEGSSLEECKRMIKRFDDNGDGFIDFQEFVKFMENTLD